AGFWKRMQGLEKGTSVATISQMDPEGSAGQRFAVLQTALRIVHDHPILGVGLGAYGLANARYNPALGDLDTHNTYLNVLAENGVPGLILFFALGISVLRTVHDTRRGRPALTAGVATQRLGAASRREDRSPPRTNPAEAAPHTPTQWGAPRGSLPYPHWRVQAPRVSSRTSDIRAARVRRPSNPRSTIWSR